MKRVHIYALTAVTLLGALLLLLASGDGKAPEKIGLFPELERQLEHSARVELRDADSTVTFIRDGHVWRVMEKDFPANVANLRRLLVSLARLRSFEKKTARPEYFSRLGLLALDQQDSRSKQIQVWDDSGELIAGLLLGDTGVNGGRYVRKPSENQTWLVSAPLRMETRAEAWLDKRLFDIPASQLRSIRVAPMKGQEYMLSRRESGELDLENLSEGVVSKAAVARLAEAFSALEFEDVKSASEISDEALQWSSIELQTLQDARILIHMTEDAGKYYLSAQQLAGRVELPNVDEWDGRYFVISAHRARAMLMEREKLISVDGQSAR